MNPSRPVNVFCLGSLLVLAFLIYLPGASGPYLADDIPNLVNNQHLLLDPLSWNSLKAAALSSPSSQFYRPLSMLSFALNYSLAGSMEAFSAKFFNILLHLGAGVLVYSLSISLLSGTPISNKDALGPQDTVSIALLATAVWLLHPLFVSTVLYTVQRMAVLNGLFTLAGCVWYIRARRRMQKNRLGTISLISGSALFTVLAFLCKENGVLLPGLLLLIEWFVFGFHFPAAMGRPERFALIAALTIPVLMVGAYIVSVAVTPWHTPAPAYELSSYERLLSQFRALTQYAGWLTFLSVEPMGIYHDDFRPSLGLLRPMTTLLSVIVWVAAIGAGFLLADRLRLFTFCLLWFLWGHALESTVLPLSLMFEHRNYLPGYGLLLGLSAGIYEGCRRLKLHVWIRNGIPAVVLLVLPTWQLTERVQAWSEERALVLHGIARQHDSALTLLMAATFLDSRGDYRGALAALHQAQRTDPQELSLFFAEAALHCEHRPEQIFEPSLKQKLDTVSRVSPATVTSRKQFVEMVKACAGSTANDPTLLGLYGARSFDPNEDVAMMSNYGIGAIQLHRGNYPAAIEFWRRAVTDYRQGELIRPMLEDLQRRYGASLTGPWD